MARRGPRPGRFILNGEPSAGVDSDWTFEDAVAAGMVAADEARPAVDLRRADWPVRDQGSTGACVGFGTADGVLHWHYREAGLLAPGERPSPRFIWMANKETDRIRSYPPPSSSRPAPRPSGRCASPAVTAACWRAPCR